MSRVNLGNSDQYVEQAEGTTWDVQIGSFDVSRAVSSLEFEDAISQPGNFKIDLVVDPGEINGGDQVTISKEDIGAFNGVVTKPERSSQRDDVIKGGGAAELLSDIPINGEFLATNTQSVVNNIFSQLSTTAIEVGLNEELSDGNGNVDVRAEDEGALKLLNRVVLSHGGDWYVTYDSQNSVYKFNVVNKLSNSTSRTFGDEAIDELRDVQVIDEEYDAVVVKGYGDGDDQVVGEFPARNTWPDDPKILRYTDKTILSSEEANTTAENVYNEHTEWRNIYLYPANENELLSLGDEVQIDDSATGVNATFRVVQRKLHISYSSPAAIEYVLSDRPIGVLDEGEDIREQTDSQTDYSQGNRNTISESNSELSNSNEGTTVEFNVPERFTQDQTGKDRTAAAYLDFSVQNYRSLISASNATVTDSSTQLYKTEVTNFGDVDKQYTEKDEFTESDMTRTPTQGGLNTGGGSQNSLGYTVDTGDSTYENGDSFTLDNTPAIQGVYITATIKGGGDNTIEQLDTLDPNSQQSLYVTTVDIDGDGTAENVVLTNDTGGADLYEGQVIVDDGDYIDLLQAGTDAPSGTETEWIDFIVRVDGNQFYPNNGSTDVSDAEPIRVWTSMAAHGKAVASFNIFVPGDHSGDQIDLRFQNVGFTTGDPDGESWSGYYNYYTISTIDTPNATANEKLQAYTADSGGGSIDASQNASQPENTELPDTGSTTLGQLDDNDLVLQKSTTNADTLVVKLNGTEIDESPFDLTAIGGPPYNKEDIKISDDSTATLNKPGFNTVTLIPQDSSGNTLGKAYVKGNVTIDHKLDSERE